MQQEPTTEQYRMLYGPPAAHSDIKAGEMITFHDPGQASGRNSGRVLYVAAPNASEGLRYIVSPNAAGFPVKVAANDLIQ